MEKLSIDRKELEDLLKRSEILRLLELGKVQNWEWYGESIGDFDYDDPIDMTEYGDFSVNGERFYKNQELYYNDNPCRFVSYLSNEIVVIVVSVKPNLDDLDGSGWCTPCQVGGTSTHTCYEYKDIIDHLRDTVEPTVIPLIINQSLLTDKPKLICKHEEKIAKIDIEIKEKKEKVLKLSEINSNLDAEIIRKKSELKVLKELEEI